MNFLIADSFTDSLAKLTADEQKAVKTTSFDLQINPANPGFSFHKLERAKDKNFWSVRVNRDLRLIVHRSPASLLLCYVDHHDKAYQWAERRKLETHPRTGAAQLVEIRERVQEVVVPVYVQEDLPLPPKEPLFQNSEDEELLSYGIPDEWLPDVRQVVDEDGLLALAERLPIEASEALLELATGGKPRPVEAASKAADPFEHPDARRRFRIVQNVEELERALEFPWEKWTVFLHPEQREWVERDYNGPARISGSAGTGKTIVALHRAVALARREPDARVLLATFTDTLASSLKTKLRRLIGNEPELAERIDVDSLPSLGSRLYRAIIGPLALVEADDLARRIAAASDEIGDHRFSRHFLLTEWQHVVDAWQLRNWEAYRDVARLGRRTRLAESQRAKLWEIFEKVHASLEKDQLLTEAEAFTKLADAITAGNKAPYDYAIVDESQDLSVSQLRFFAALGSDQPNSLFFAGDPGQRIFQQPISWKSLGVDIRGRSRTLRVNYRTSHQIRSQADRLLGPEITDADGNRELRSDTVSVFNGVPPEVRSYGSERDESVAVGEWLSEQISNGVLPHEIGVFVRSSEQLGRAKEAVDHAGLDHRVLDEHLQNPSGSVAISTMHLAKGLEFRAVAVMACDDEVIPLQARIEAVGDNADLQDVYETERNLLYVACTRARDRLLITSTEPGSEFLDDLNAL